MQTFTIEDFIKDAATTQAKMYSSLMYGSYKANRDLGMTHEQLLSIGIGNDEMKDRYDNILNPKL